MAQIPKQKAAKLFEQARLHLSKEQFAEAERILKDIATRSDLHSPLVVAALGEAEMGMGRVDEAIDLYRQGLQKFPHDADLHSRLGIALIRQNRLDEALRHFERAESRLKRDPAMLRNHGYALLVAGKVEEAEKMLFRAVAAGGGPEAKLTLALAWAKAGRYKEAEEACARLGSMFKIEGLADAARALRAECLLFLGNATAALELWKDLRSRDKLEPDQLAHVAYAAQIAGDTALCDDLIADCTSRGSTAEDLLLFAQIANLRSDPNLALERLDASANAPGERHPGYDFELAATRGRSLRLLGRREEARRVLEETAQRPEADNARLGPKLHVDLGHLAAEDGDFETAARHFKRALELDPDEPEAKRGLALTERRVAWRTELTASAEARVEAAKAEAEAMRRHFSAREGELEALRRELEKMKEAQREAEERAKRAEEEARQRVAAVKSEQDKRVREELQQREAEIAEKAAGNVALALGPEAARCPPALRSALLVAETTFQKALYTELPAAAVAVLFAGALERALYLLFVERFRAWLQAKGRLAEFLKAATRERRGTRVEYFDHFVEAFDEDRPGKAPSMGEVGRVIERRKEPYLAPFLQFLQEHHPQTDDTLYGQLVGFVLWAKEKLRDPVAHGRGIEMGYEELRTFREQLLFSFAGTGRGVLANLLSGA